MEPQQLDESVRFSCGNCTCCCDQPWHTMIEASKAHALDRHDFSAYPQLAGKVFYRKTKNKRYDGFYRLAKGVGTRCLFLDGDGLCIIHIELGPEAKPHMCRQFPYLPARAGGRVSANYGCPSVQDQAGTPFLEQSSEVGMLLARPKRSQDTHASMHLDATSALTPAEGDAFFDRVLPLFDEDCSANVWAQFASLLALLDIVREHKTSADPLNGRRQPLIDWLRSEASLTDVTNTPEIRAYANPAHSPMQTRLLFAATLYPDTIPPDAVTEMGVLRRLTLIPKLMALGTLTGVYASRVLGRNISIHDVMNHEVGLELDAGASRLLMRYFRSRLWQRYQAGTRLGVIAGVHQHIHDFNAVVFLARAEACQAGVSDLTEPLIRKALTAVEFHLANQVRLYDHTLRGWFLAQLQSMDVAKASLRLMALQRSPAHLDARVVDVAGQ